MEENTKQICVADLINEKAITVVVMLFKAELMFDDFVKEVSEEEENCQDFDDNYNEFIGSLSECIKIAHLISAEYTNNQINKLINETK